MLNLYRVQFDVEIDSTLEGYPIFEARITAYIAAYDAASALEFLDGERDDLGVQRTHCLHDRMGHTTTIELVAQNAIPSDRYGFCATHSSEE